MSEDQSVSDVTNVTQRPAEGRELLLGVASLWWILLLRGAMLIALGGYALLMPGVTLTAYAFVLGVFVLLEGLLAILSGLLGWVVSRWWSILRGVVGILAGLFVIAHPAIVGIVAVTTIVILLAVQSIVNGLIEIVTAIRERKQIEGEWWLVLGGVLSVLFGGILLASPLLSAALLVQVLGAFAAIAGVLLIVAAFRLRSAAKGLET